MKIWPQLKEVPESTAQRNSRGLKPYFQVYPKSSDTLAVASVVIIAVDSNSNETAIVIGIE